jgi:DNA-directed RNA polymerase specialized sigma24 family protein
MVEREEQFDSFYRSTRSALLHQSFALTGDLPAAQAAVRDAYVAAWHHWRKVSRLDDPLEWVRPRAWQFAQRRHTARIWHRSRGLSEQHKSVLDALARLGAAQRRVLLLTQLAAVPVPAAARELGMTQDVLAQHLQAATANMAALLDTDSVAVRGPLVGLDDALTGASLPRPSIVRRAGRKRRQAHTVAAAGAAALVTVAAGAFAYQPDVAPPSVRIIRPPIATPAPARPTPAVPTADALLDQDQIRRLGLRQRWTVARTHDNTSGDGINTICQQRRFADPDGLSALVRGFAARGRPTRSAVQTVEVSRSIDQARRAFRTTLGWYAGCRVARLQLLDAYRVDNIGDEANVLMIRVWSRPVTTYSVGIARIGRVTSTTVGRSVGASPPAAAQITQSLADSVAMLCATSGSKGCAKHPVYRVVPPPPSGEERGILAVADLPPVGRIDEPWVGTEATPARRNPSRTTCDRASFSQADAVRTRTRTYLIPQSDLPARFGLSETYGVFRSVRDATRFLADVRRNVAGCEERDLAATVTASRRERLHRRPADLSTWQITIELSEHASVPFRLGFVRVGTKVAQLTFASAPRDDMSGKHFHDLVVRAGDRLRELGT